MENKIEELEARITKLEWTTFIMINAIVILFVYYLYKSKNG